METVKILQKQLIDLYRKNLMSYEGGNNLSVPHMPRVTESYLNNRTIVVGQETNTWYREGDDDFKNVFVKNNNLKNDCLVERYDKFISEYAESYGGKFWEFNRKLYSESILSGRMVTKSGLTHCWVNLFVVEACDNKNHKEGRPTKDGVLAKKVMEIQKKILFEAFSILKPKKIIFLTGHSLDGYMIHNAINSDNISITSIDAKGILNHNQAGCVIVNDQSHVLNRCKILRLYHPTYFMGYINGYSTLKNKMIENEIDSSVSSYYQSVVFKFLKSC